MSEPDSSTSQASTPSGSGVDTLELQIEKLWKQMSRYYTALSKEHLDAVLKDGKLLVVYDSGTRLEDFHIVQGVEEMRTKCEGRTWANTSVYTPLNLLPRDIY